MNAALDAAALATAPGRSLAIPTWRYGQEPTIPFATAYAKYFQNSIREETLISSSRAGIVYAQGGGGTCREVFEDAEANYYAGTPQAFTPMIFFDSEDFWQKNARRDASGKVLARGLNLEDVIGRLFELAHETTAGAFLKKVAFTTDHQEILTLLNSHAGHAESNLAKVLGGRPMLTFASYRSQERYP